MTGLLSLGGMGADCDPGFATIWGDLLAEADFGVAGGGIRISDKDSGETDSASELSWLMAMGNFCTGRCGTFVERLAFPASSMISETLFDGMLVLDSCFFLVWGFIEGDCRTVRERLRCAVVEAFLRDLRAPFRLGFWRLGSIFMSVGEVVSDVSEPRTALYTDL